MTDIVKYLRNYYDRVFQPGHFLLVLLLMGTLIYLNYWHQLERRYAAGGQGWTRGFLGYYFFYAAPFWLAFVLEWVFNRQNAPWISHPWFWVIVLVAPAIFAFRVNFTFHLDWVHARWEMPGRIFYERCISWIIRVLVVLVPIFIIWWIKDRNQAPFYGLAPLGDAKPYWWMLLMMVPLIALASTQPDFLQAYPKAKVLAALPESGWWQRLRYLVYEGCYGFDFVSIEFFFRGFLILALVRICGMHCILPMACFYCSIHFGKPMGEAISSFWGGLLLGIISYHTGSVWGGLLVHLGIAWMMELGGALGHWLKK